jgi:ferric-dicitrate binding protein FerR (iron transport regulator)
MKELVTERMLQAYFEKRATAHEKLLIKEWLRVEGNEEIFYQHLTSWESTHLQFTPTEESFSRYQKFLDNQDHSGKTMRISPAARMQSARPKVFRYIAAAASVALLISLVFYFTRDYFLYDHYSTAYGMTKNIMLEDGSEVTLNANSTLKVSRNIASSEIREVWIDGEAFFAIAKRPDHVRFQVHTDNLNVEVLGTKFNVNNRRGHTEVVLTEGSVKLTSYVANENRILFMKPGDYVSLSETDTSFKQKVVVPDNYADWQSNQLVFVDTPLRVVAERIEDYYGVTIEIPDQRIAERELTGTLPNNDLGIVLRSLTTSHNLKIKRDEERIIFE